MPIEILFVGVLEGFAKDALKFGVHEAIRAMAEQEILETDVNRLVSQPFRSANAHLQNASLEVEDQSRQREHIEYARLDFVKASDLDAPLPAARAAFYAGLCHRLRHEPIHELFWYERSLSMLSEVEANLEKKAAAMRGNRTLQFTKLVNPLVGVPLDMYLKAVTANLNRQLQTIRDHKSAVKVVVDAVKAYNQEQLFKAQSGEG